MPGQDLGRGAEHLGLLEAGLVVGDGERTLELQLKRDAETGMKVARQGCCEVDAAQKSERCLRPVVLQVEQEEVGVAEQVVEVGEVSEAGCSAVQETKKRAGDARKRKELLEKLFSRTTLNSSKSPGRPAILAEQKQQQEQQDNWFSKGLIAGTN